MPDPQTTLTLWQRIKIFLHWWFTPDVMTQLQYQKWMEEKYGDWKN